MQQLLKSLLLLAATLALICNSAFALYFQSNSNCGYTSDGFLNLQQSTELQSDLSLGVCGWGISSLLDPFSDQCLSCSFTPADKPYCKKYTTLVNSTVWLLAPESGCSYQGCWGRDTCLYGGYLKDKALCPDGSINPLCCPYKRYYRCCSVKTCVKNTTPAGSCVVEDKDLLPGQQYESHVFAVPVVSTDCYYYGFNITRVCNSSRSFSTTEKYYESCTVNQSSYDSDGCPIVPGYSFYRDEAYSNVEEALLDDGTMWSEFASNNGTELSTSGFQLFLESASSDRILMGSRCSLLSNCAAFDTSGTVDLRYYVPTSAYLNSISSSSVLSSSSHESLSSSRKLFGNIKDIHVAWNDDFGSDRNESDSNFVNNELHHLYRHFSDQIHKKLKLPSLFNREFDFNSLSAMSIPLRSAVLPSTSLPSLSKSPLALTVQPTHSSRHLLARSMTSASCQGIYVKQSPSSFCTRVSGFLFRPYQTFTVVDRIGDSSVCSNCSDSAQLGLVCSSEDDCIGFSSKHGLFSFETLENLNSISSSMNTSTNSDNTWSTSNTDVFNASNRRSWLQPNSAQLTTFSTTPCVGLFLKVSNESYFDANISAEGYFPPEVDYLDRNLCGEAAYCPNAQLEYGASVEWQGSYSYNVDITLNIRADFSFPTRMRSLDSASSLHVLSNVRSFHINCLNGSKIDGGLPVALVIAMSFLQELVIRHCGINDMLPVDWSGFEYLKVLDLSGNHLYGTLPQEWGTYLRLSHLNLSSNYLTGYVPSTWSELISRTYYPDSSTFFSANSTSSLPAFPAVADLSYNLLSGPLPHSFIYSTCVRHNKAMLFRFKFFSSIFSFLSLSPMAVRDQQQELVSFLAASEGLPSFILAGNEGLAEWVGRYRFARGKTFMSVYDNKYNMCGSIGYIIALSFLWGVWFLCTLMLLIFRRRYRRKAPANGRGSRSKSAIRALSPEFNLALAMGRSQQFLNLKAEQEYEEEDLNASDSETEQEAHVVKDNQMNGVQGKEDEDGDDIFKKWDGVDREEDEAEQEGEKQKGEKQEGESTEGVSRPLPSKSTLSLTSKSEKTSMSYTGLPDSYKSTWRYRLSQTLPWPFASWFAYSSFSSSSSFSPFSYSYSPSTPSLSPSSSTPPSFVHSLLQRLWPKGLFRRLVLLLRILYLVIDVLLDIAIVVWLFGDSQDVDGLTCAVFIALPHFLVSLVSYLAVGHRIFRSKLSATLASPFGLACMPLLGPLFALLNLRNPEIPLNFWRYLELVEFCVAVFQAPVQAVVQSIVYARQNQMANGIYINHALFIASIAMSMGDIFIALFKMLRYRHGLLRRFCLAFYRLDLPRVSLMKGRAGGGAGGGGKEWEEREGSQQKNQVGMSDRAVMGGMMALTKLEDMGWNAGGRGRGWRGREKKMEMKMEEEGKKKIDCFVNNPLAFMPIDGGKRGDNGDNNDNNDNGNDGNKEEEKEKEVFMVRAPPPLLNPAAAVPMKPGHSLLWSSVSRLSGVSHHLRQQQVLQNGFANGSSNSGASGGGNANGGGNATGNDNYYHYSNSSNNNSDVSNRNSNGSNEDDINKGRHYDTIFMDQTHHNNHNHNKSDSKNRDAMKSYFDNDATYSYHARDKEEDNEEEEEEKGGNDDVAVKTRGRKKRESEKRDMMYNEKREGPSPLAAVFPRVTLEAIRARLQMTAKASNKIKGEGGGEVEGGGGGRGGAATAARNGCESETAINHQASLSFNRSSSSFSASATSSAPLLLSRFPTIGLPSPLLSPSIILPPPPPPLPPLFSAKALAESRGAVRNTTKGGIISMPDREPGGGARRGGEKAGRNLMGVGGGGLSTVLGESKKEEESGRYQKRPSSSSNRKSKGKSSSFSVYENPIAAATDEQEGGGGMGEGRGL